MKIGVLTETATGENRVATTPLITLDLIRLGFDVAIEAGAGSKAGYADEDYLAAGASIAPSAEDLWSTADIVLKVRSPNPDSNAATGSVLPLRSGQILISFISPAQNPALLETLAGTGATVLAIDAVPRITRAQKLDALSSMANIAGYRAVIEAANCFGRFFTGQMTAAGKTRPAKVLVIGAGVAGLSAMGAAMSLGAIVRAFDTRLEVREQIQSMGAEFLLVDIEEDGGGTGGYARVMSDEFIQAEMALFAQQAKEVDIIITTAQIPGKPAPVLITADMVHSMAPGSVIVDLAAEQGGNCELTQPGQRVMENGVTILGYTDLVSRMASQSSQLYASNLRHLINDLCPEKDGTLTLDFDDQVVRAMTVVHEGKVTWPPPPIETTPVSTATTPTATNDPKVIVADQSTSNSLVGLVITALLILGVGSVAPPAFMAHFTVFVLSIFIGWQVIWNVTPALHTPLMSVTNAISGIIVVGALLQIDSTSSLVVILAAVSVLIASINVAGGFLVTQKMLAMFKKEH